MGGPQERQANDPMDNTKSILKLGIFVIHAFASQHELIWRVPGYSGRRYFGSQALLGYVFAIPTAAYACPPLHGGHWLLFAWRFLFILWIVHRVASLASARKRIHSYDIGRSWLSLLFGIPNRTAQTVGELVSSILVGLVLGGVCETLAFACVAGGMLNLIHIGLIEARYTRIAENSRDQRIEGMAIGDRIRDLDR